MKNRAVFVCTNMQIIHEIHRLREALNHHEGHSSIIGLVPTMGAIHEGHLTLIREARKTCDIVVVTIFVNPTQFGPSEDLDRYPRTLEADSALCQQEGVDYIFAPSVSEIYPGKQYLSIQIEGLADTLCGASRPGHFNGVLQVVNKLLQIVGPHHAYFGQKDIQQFVLIATMVREFNIPVTLHAVPTVRESDGLALSSRNRYLDTDNRLLAPKLYKSISEIGMVLKSLLEFNDDSDRYNEKNERIFEAVSDHKKMLTAIGFKIDYLEVVDFKSLQPINNLSGHDKFIVAIAAWLGNTRLIDNIIIENRAIS